MARSKNITVKNTKIILFEQNKQDYISLTDIARYKNKDHTGLVISHWLSTKYTVEFMGIWEKMHNNNFNITEFRNIKNEIGSNGYVLSSKQWINKTNSIGLISKAGRYGGTYAHKDIAFEFASWISAEFKLFLIKEFQRLKEQEIEREKLGWNLKRNLAAINYRIHTDAVQEYLIPPQISAQQSNLTYANEADVLNKALFGLTANEWRKSNAKKKGNIRDYATVHQLVCLSNLESLNAQYIREELPQVERLKKLNTIAIIQMKSLLGLKTLKIL